MISTPSTSAAFIMDPSPDGGIDLFRKASAGFVLVDTFDTPAAAHTFIEESAAGTGKAKPAYGAHPASAAT